MKAFLLQEIIPSYRVPVFRRIAKLDDVDLTVFYSRPSSVMQRENLKSSANIAGFRHIKIGLWEFWQNAYQFGIIRHVLANRPDVVIAGNAGSLDRLLLLLLCKVLNIRVLWFLGGVPYVNEMKIREYANRGRMNRWLGKYNPRWWFIRQADGVIAYSEHAKHYFMAGGFREEAIWVAPNSPDTDALEIYRKELLQRPDDLDVMRKKFAPSGGKIVFLLGRLNEARKVDVLLQALQIVSDRGMGVSLVIVGDGGERNSQVEMADKLELDNIFFEGAIYDEKELSKYFYICDIFVTPGVSSLAIKMAMLFGKPVITVDYGLEVHAVQEGFNGYIFPMDDVEALAEKIQMLLQSDELMMRIGEGGRSTIRDSININQMIEGFRKAIFEEYGTEASELRTDCVDMQDNEKDDSISG